MATQFSMLQIINAALAAQGQYTVTSDDGSDEWSVLSRNWPTIVEAELEDGAYSFTRREVVLLTRTEGAFGYDDGYAIPLTALHVRSVWTETDTGERTFIDWTQDGSNVYVNEDGGCMAEILEVANPDIWSANFVRGVQCKLEALILRAFKEESTDSDRMEARAEQYFERARTISSKSRTAKSPYREGRFALARFGRG